MDKLKGLKKNAKEIVLVSVALLIAGIVILATKLVSKNDAEMLSKEISRSMTYSEVHAGDEAVTEKGTENVVENVKFDAFFLRDLNGDGYAESIRGTCREIGGQDTLYMELKVEAGGRLENAKIQINGNNFYLKTTFPKDQQLKANYISANTKTIEFNTLSSGTQRLLAGKTRSGDYTTAYSNRYAALGNNITNYSRSDNKVVLTGTYVSSNGTETQIEKEVPLTVDWHGSAKASIYTTNISRSISDFTSLYDESNLNISFTVQTSETENKLLLKDNVLTGTVPALNGYMPTNVTISGTNVTFTYNKETGEFTATREAKVANNVITTNAYTSQNGNTRYGSYNFTVTYPREAYEAESNQSVTLNIPMQTYYEGYNNANEEFGSPYKSNTASSTVVVTLYQYVPSSQSTSIDVQVGKYMGSPYNRYYVSKEKPERIYSGVSEEETEDRYTVTWYAFTGTNTNYSKLVLKENVNDSTDAIDTFIKADSTQESMDGITTNVGIYFSNPTNLLGNEGWIKVYNDENNEELVTFNSSNWNNYSSNNPYMYASPVKHVRIETSSTNSVSSIYFYNIKELNDDAITTKYDEAQFEALKQIRTNLKVYLGDNTTPSTDTATANYEKLYSAASFAISKDALSTQEEYKNEILTITTRSSNFLEQKWQNAKFLVKMPEDIMKMSVNSVTINNNAVTISETNLYEENGNYYLRIETANETPDTYAITVDCNITPNPRMATKTESIEMYAKNEGGAQYSYSAQDANDVDANGNVTEYVHKSTAGIALVAPDSLLTHQTATNYDGENSETVAPQIAKVEKSQSTANVEITITNNYSDRIKNIVIQGVLPYTGNKSVIGNADLGSNFNVSMSGSGITIPAELASYATVYYSTLERPTKDLTDNANGWVTKENVSNWAQIKSFLIDLSNYELVQSASHTMSYQINIPSGVNYNDVSYSSHAVYFDLVTEMGLYSTSTEVSKLGFMIVKQYDLALESYQVNTSKKLAGTTFRITEIGNADNTIKKSTDANGTLTVSNLYVEKRYKIQQTSIAEDYVLNSEEIEFYTYVDESDNLAIAYHNESTGANTALTEKYNWVKSAGTTKENEKDYKATIALNNAVKAKLKIVKTGNSEPLKGAKFELVGQGKNTIITTNASGNATASGIFLGQTYTLTETKAKGYYLNSAITFSVTDTGSGFTDSVTGPATGHSVEVADEIPTITIQIDDEKIPTYSLKVTTYAKEKQDTTLAGTQYRLTGDGLADSGILLTADANGAVNIDGLYEYVEEAGVAKGGYSGEYTITQIYAPEGYTLNPVTVTFKASRDNGELKVQVLSGESSISELDTAGVTEATSANPTVKFGFENEPIFALKAFDEGRNPLAGAKFTIQEINGTGLVVGWAKDSKGNTVGEYDSENDRYLVTTGESGKLSIDLKKGYYKVIEVEVPEEYVLVENEAERTQLFGIDQSQSAQLEFAIVLKTAIKGEGFNTINSTFATEDGGFVAVGSLYGNADIAGTTYTSQGRKDGLVIKYGENNSIEWVKTIGGTLGEEFKKVVQTKDGGYAVVGYFESETMNVGSGAITNSGARDAILIKLDGSGTYEWSAVIGGTLEDYAYSVCEDSGNNILVSGGYFSNTLSFKGTNGVAGTTLTNLGDMDGYVASFDKDGKFNWAQNIGSTNATSGVQAVDVLEIENKYAVAVNYWGTLYVDSAKTASITNAGNQDSALVYYNSDGSYNKYIAVSGAGYDDIRGVTVDEEGYTVVYGNRTNSTTTLTGTEGETDIAAVGGTTYLSGYIYRLDSTGKYVKSKCITFGNTAGNDEIMQVVATEDGGLLIGGFTYSTTLDFDGDGTADMTSTGLSGTSYSRGFIAKLGEDNKVEVNNGVKTVYKQYLNNYYQETRTVAQTKDGGLVAGGVVDGTSLNLDINNTVETLTGLDAYSVDGFVVKYGSREIAPAINKKSEVEYVNNLKPFSVTVMEYSVENGEEQEDFLYDTGATVVGSYTEDFPEAGHKKYVETVKYGQNGERSILIVPDANYAIVGITVNGEEYEYTISQTDGSVTIPAFENVTENKIVIVKVNKNMTEIKINHYLWTEQNGITQTKVADTDSIYGKVGEDYQTSPNQNIDYDVIRNADFYLGKTEAEVLNAIGKSSWANTEYENFEDFKADFYIPGNASGKYPAGGTTVSYYYKEREYTLTVKHLMAGTETPMENKNTSEPIEDEITGRLLQNAAYTANKSENVDYNMYEVVDVSTSDENAVVNEETQQVTGTILEDTTITYYYQVKNAGAITVHHYITGTTDKVPSDTGDVIEDVVITTVTEEGNTRDAKIGDTYTSAVASNLAQNYVLDQAPANATVTFALEPQEVTYYYKMVEPTLSNTVTATVNKATMADSDADQSLTYTITYTATVGNYKGNVSTTITDKLPFKIDTTKSYSLDGGTYDEATKTVTWKQVHEVDTYANAGSGTINITKTLTLTYKDIPVTTGNIVNTIEANVKAVETNTSSETSSQTAQTTYTHFRNITVTNTWDAGVETPATSVKVNLIGTVTNPDTSTLRVNLTALDPNIVTQATLNNSTGTENGANWTYNWSQLPKYDALGRQIVYTVEVDPSIDYTKFTPEVTGNMDNGYAITIYNTFGGATEKQTAVQYYDTNDGTTDVNFEARENGFTRRGYTFENWRLESPTGTDYNPHDTVTVNPGVDSDKTTYDMYAIWGQQ